MDGFRALWQRTRERLAQATSSPISAARNPAVAAYLDEVLATFPYTDAAQSLVPQRHHLRGGEPQQHERRRLLVSRPLRRLPLYRAV